jgi:hypothetical protein
MTYNNPYLSFLNRTYRKMHHTGLPDVTYIARLSKNPQNCDFGNFRINDINKLQASKTRIQGFSTPMKKLPSSKKEF